LWGHDAVTDSWAGFAVEKASLLEAFHSVPNIVILTGDRHEFAAIEFNSKDAYNPVFEFSTSPLSMFYVPFLRTLRMRSEEVVQRNRTRIVTNNEGVEDVITIVDEIPQERVMKYLPIGNHKW
jgi:alkaline phosphatase D